MKRITTKSGRKGYECKLRDNYGSFDEFEGYSHTFGLAAKLGFETAMEAWQENPTIQGSTNPDDFRIAPSTPVNEVKDKQQESKQPLYKVLDSERTKGNLRVAEYASCISLLLDKTNGETMYTFCDFTADMLKDAQYTAIAVNNLASLAEALEKINDNCIKTFEAYAAEKTAIPSYILNTLGAISETAKEALSRIS